MRLTIALISIAFIISCNTDQVPAEVDCATEGPELTAESTPAECSPPTGTITATVSGGRSPYQYELEAVETNETGVFTGLSAGNYRVIVTDANECTATTQVSVASLSGPSLSAVATDSGCETSEGTITVTASGGTGALSYQIGDGTPQSSNVFNGLSAGSYEVRVLDEAGCFATETVEIASGISLDSNVMPIISANCAVSGCHNGTQSPNLSTKSGVIGSANSILSRVAAGTMPPAGSLPQSQIDAISCWVGDGANDN